MKKVLLIAGLQEEYYFKPFLVECEKVGISIHLFDPDRIPVEDKLNIYLDGGGHLSGYIETLQFVGNDFLRARLPVHDIDVAWYLRENSRTHVENESLEIQFARKESEKAINSLFSVLDCKWINRPETLLLVGTNKLYQQKLAAQCGLTVPSTLVSNDPVEVIAKATTWGGLLAKPMGYITLSKEKFYTIYSECFSLAELQESETAIRNCPLFAQEYVNKRFEYRVMVIGSKVLACQIDSQASELTKIDWRHYDFEKVAHVKYTLPVEVCDKLQAFMKAINLTYGAIDMIETPGGDFVFLEINPSGQWEWISYYADLPIPQAVAEMLVSA